MAETDILYVGRPGKRNTDDVIAAVVKRLGKGGIDNVVVASRTGSTARKMLRAIGERPVKVIAVTSHCGFEKEGGCEMSQGVLDGLSRNGVTVVRASHVLSGVERSLTRKFGGASRVEAIAEAIRSLFGQGVKVCIEVTVMAADSGAIPVGDVEVIAVGGTGTGADTACVVRPAHSNAFFNFEVREIIAMPRQRGTGGRK